MQVCYEVKTDLVQLSPVKLEIIDAHLVLFSEYSV